MENKFFQKNVVLLLILNKRDAFKDSYSLVNALSRWFNIIDFNNLVSEMINENLIERFVMNQISNYSITEKGRLIFNKERNDFEELLRKEHPTQLEVIDVLFNNLSIQEDME